MESFLSAVHHFTAVRISRVASRPIDAAVLAWLPVIGILSALLAISFYLPLATLYFPMDVAVIPGLIAVSWLRGFKPEIDFCQLCDLLFGHRKHFTAHPVPGVPGTVCLVFVILLKYAILRQFYVLESVRLLAFGTLVSFIAPLLRPTTDAPLAIDSRPRLAHRKRRRRFQRLEELDESRISLRMARACSCIRFRLSGRQIDFFTR